MTDLTKFISSHIAQQFPSFYRDNGPAFITFVQAYYEWLESTTGDVVTKTRSLPEYFDIDTTADEFVKYFLNTYVSEIPEYMLADKRKLIKHILDLYRSKGTKRAYELLFRIVFNEDISLYFPGQHLLRPSDGVWTIPKYIETTGNPYLYKLVGNQIRSSSGNATAVVESVTEKIEQNRVINVIYLSSIQGTFQYGEQIYCDQVEEITIDNAPTIIGSLTAISITNGGYGFQPGDTLDVVGAGSDGKARVVSTRDENGKVIFTLLNGGSGFSTNAIITVNPNYTTINYQEYQAFQKGETVYQTASGSSNTATGTVYSSNSSVAILTGVTGAFTAATGSNVEVVGENSLVKNNLTSVNVSSGGTGASFKIGGLTNKELFYYNNDIINGYKLTTLDFTSSGVNVAINTLTSNFSLPGNTVSSTANIVILDCQTQSITYVQSGEKLSNTSLGITDLYAYRSEESLIWLTSSNDSMLSSANLVSGITLVSDVTNSVITLNTVWPKNTIVSNGIIVTSNTSSITVNYVNGYFIPSRSITDNYSGATANIVAVTRNTNWEFPSWTAGLPYLDNLDTPLYEVLTYKLLEVGTITYLSHINPGSGYSNDPIVDIIEPDIESLNIPDGFGGFKGHNAYVNAIATNAKGIITAVEVIDSGFGYNNGETVTLNSANGLNQVVLTGKSIVDIGGVGTGYWKDSRGFLDDINYVQDSNFYQDYSYQIQSRKMIEKYESLVRNLIHPAGIALFGMFQIKDYIESNTSVVKSFSFTSS